MKRSNVSEAASVIQQLAWLNLEGDRVGRLQSEALAKDPNTVSVLNLMGSRVEVSKTCLINIIDAILNDIETRTDILKSRLTYLGVED